MAKNKSSTSGVEVEDVELLSSAAEARPNDVYIGRGNEHFVRYNHGLFTKLIREHTKKYFQIPKGSKKRFIKNVIVKAIHKSGGDFFTNQCPREFRVWKVASEDSVIRKIKLELTAESIQLTAKSGRVGNQTSNNVTKKATPEPSVHHGCQPTINHSNKRPYTAVENSNLQTSSSIPTNTLIDTALARAKSLVQQNSPIASPTRTRVQQNTTLYINERTGHLLNVASRENNLYHDLLAQNAGPFQQLFGRNDDLWKNDDQRIRFVWDNIVSQLQRSKSFHIVLCPDSEKSIDVDPKDLRLTENPNRSTDITFRTIRAITAALGDLHYIATEQAAKKQKLEMTWRIQTTSLEMEVMQMRAQLIHLMHCDSMIPILQRQWLEQQPAATTPCSPTQQQDPAMVSDCSARGDPTPQTNNDVAPAVDVHSNASNKSIESIEATEEIEERQHLERPRYTIADVAAISVPNTNTELLGALVKPNTNTELLRALVNRNGLRQGIEAPPTVVEAKSDAYAYAAPTPSNPAAASAIPTQQAVRNREQPMASTVHSQEVLRPLETESDSTDDDDIVI